jgi:hypothetical protein
MNDDFEREIGSSDLLTILKLCLIHSLSCSSKYQDLKKKFCTRIRMYFSPTIIQVIFPWS